MNLPADYISQAIDLSWGDFFSNLKPMGKVEFYDGPDVLRFFSGVPHPIFNAIFRSKLYEPNVDVIIDQILEKSRSQNMPMTWSVGPLSRPKNLGARLKAHGMKLGESIFGMALNLDCLNEQTSTLTGLCIEEVQDSAALEDYLHVFGIGFEMMEYMVDFFREGYLLSGFGANSPWKHYLARYNNKPVGCSSVLLYRGIAGIYNVATLPEYRKHGIGQAVTSVPLNAARNDGYHLAVLQATTMGKSVYQRLGFQEFCRLEEYVF